LTQTEPRSTADAVLTAARTRLLADGYAGLSTRNVAAEAGVPLSQLHYHFGSKGGLVLALLTEENRRRLARQTEMYAEEMPLWKRYEQACDFLEDDLESGYVRVLNELLAAGWSNPELGQAARDTIRGWYELLTQVAREAEEALGGLGPFTAEEVATLVTAGFIGGESLLLLGFERSQVPVRAALRRFGQIIRALEERKSTTSRERDREKS
jgi:AcrR family transcriptional regulator